MFPIGDDNSGVTRASLVNILIILVNILVFVFLQGMGSNQAFDMAFSAVPAEILSGHDVQGSFGISSGGQTGTMRLEHTPIPVYLTLITSMFMHGGFAHIFGNMMFLWVFGDNLEHAMGHIKFLFFYLTCGVLAALAHVFATSFAHQDLNIPMLGASGAISGVLGGYIMLFPHRRVRVLVMRMVTDMPAIAALGIWFLFQIIEGMGLLGGGGGVAYGAHIGGFVAGCVLVHVFADRNLVEEMNASSNAGYNY